MTTHSSVLAWRIPMDRGAWWAAVHGVSKSRTGLSDFTFTFHFHAVEKEMATTPVLLPGKSHGWRSLVGCSPWGHKESDMTEWLSFHFSLSSTGEGNGNPLQCSCLENPRDRGAWWAAVYGVAQSRTRLKRLSSSSMAYYLSSVLKMSHYFLQALHLPHFLSLNLWYLLLESFIYHCLCVAH